MSKNRQDKIMRGLYDTEETHRTKDWMEPIN